MSARFPSQNELPGIVVTLAQSGQRVSQFGRVDRVAGVRVSLTTDAGFCGRFSSAGRILLEDDLGVFFVPVVVLRIEDRRVHLELVSLGRGPAHHRHLYVRTRLALGRWATQLRPEPVPPDMTSAPRDEGEIAAHLLSSSSGRWALPKSASVRFSSP